MNTRSSPLRRLLVGSWLALGVLFAGCDFSHPYDEPSGAAMDPALLGSWIDANPEPGKEPGALEITAVSQTEYQVEYSGEKFRVWRVPKTPDNFLQMRRNAWDSDEPSTRNFVFCLFSFDGGELVVHRVVEPQEKSEQPTTTEAVRAWVGRAVQGESYQARVYRFVRRPDSPNTQTP